METLSQINILLARPFRGVIWIYQKTISPDHGFVQVLYPYGYCQFHPSCSAYADLVLKQKGLLGIPKIIKRLIACRPSL